MIKDTGLLINMFFSFRDSMVKLRISALATRILFKDELNLPDHIEKEIELDIEVMNTYMSEIFGKDKSSVKDKPKLRNEFSSLFISLVFGHEVINKNDFTLEFLVKEFNKISLNHEIVIYFSIFEEFLNKLIDFVINKVIRTKHEKNEDKINVDKEIEKEIKSIKWNYLPTRLRELETDYYIKNILTEDEEKILVKYYESRNCIVHHGGKVSKKYIGKVDTELKEGDLILINEKDTGVLFYLLIKIAEKLRDDLKLFDLKLMFIDSGVDFN